MLEFVERVADATGLRVGIKSAVGEHAFWVSSPLVFADHVALPFRLAALLAFGLGCDMINVGREAMVSIGCIQAQRCHTGRCPSRVATQSEGSSTGSIPPSRPSVWRTTPL